MQCPIFGISNKTAMCTCPTILRENQAPFVTKRYEGIKGSKKTCKSGFEVNISWKAIIGTDDIADECLGGLIFSLLNRCFKICSTYVIFHAEVEKLKHIFINNGYPVKLLDRWIASFLDKVFSKSTKLLTAPKRVVYLSLPFTGQHFSHIRTQIKKPFLIRFSSPQH